MTREQILEAAMDLIISDKEFGNLDQWTDPQQEDFDLVLCDWDCDQEEWIVKIRAWFDDGGSWLLSLALDCVGQLKGSIYDVER
jgi:hypothetical protein